MTGSNVIWQKGGFDDLTARQIHDLLRLRQQVFIIEQNCIFPDIDGLDPQCGHVIGLMDGRVVAAARIVPPGIDADHAAQGDHVAIGRVVADGTIRGQGLGRGLMAASMAYCDALFPGTPIFLNAQVYLKAFYQSFGFAQTSDIFVEDGIDHISMLRMPD